MTNFRNDHNGPGHRKVLILATSSAPFSMSEIWFQSEVIEVEKDCDVVFAPVWPRGKKQDWAGQLLTSSGRPPFRPIALVHEFVRSRELRKMLISCRTTVNLRTALKCVAAVVAATLWTIEIRRRNLDVCHVHATTVGAPSAAAGVFGELLNVSTSSTAHRNDIKVHAPRMIMQKMTLNRAISSRAQAQLQDRQIESEVLRFGGIGRAASELAISDGPDLRCVAIGHLLPRKGQFRAIRMVANARAAGVPITLEIFGAGSLREELQNLIDELSLGDVVQLKGLMPHSELVDTMFANRWNALIHTSVQIGEDDEGIPVAVLEAAAAGLVIVATSSGATAEFVIGDSNGILIEPTNDELCIEMGTAGLIALSSGLQLRNRLRIQALLDVGPYLAENSVRAMEIAIQSRKS